MSKFRAALGGHLRSRPYRLDLPVHSDVSDLLGWLRAGYVAAAAAAYGRDLLPASESPALAEYGHFITMALRKALEADPLSEALLSYLERAPHDVDLLQHYLLA